MTDQTQPYRLAEFCPASDTGLERGMVLILRPIRPSEADLFETGPMFRVRYLATGAVRDAFLDELRVTVGDPRPIEWGDWWNEADYMSPGAVQFYIETGKRQTRRESFEHSIAADRARFDAEYTEAVRRAVALVSA